MFSLWWKWEKTAPINKCSSINSHNIFFFINLHFFNYFMQYIYLFLLLILLCVYLLVISVPLMCTTFNHCTPTEVYKFETFRNTSFVVFIYSFSISTNCHKYNLFFCSDKQLAYILFILIEIIIECLATTLVLL